jgi:hypothetical protein
MKLENISAILRPIIIGHGEKMGAIRKGATDKKKNALVNSVIGAIISSEMSEGELIQCLKDSESGRIINTSFFYKGGNVWDYVDSRYHSFAKQLYHITNKGIAGATPNANPGEGELMFVFLSPEITSPTSGDIVVNGEKIELKAADDGMKDIIRVFGSSWGEDFGDATVKLAKKYGLTPNKPLSDRAEGAELQMKWHEDHWKNELAKISDSKQKKFITEWLKEVSKYTTDDHVTSVLNGGYDVASMKKVILKVLFEEMASLSTDDKICFLFKEGQKSIIIDWQGATGVQKFNKLVDNGDIIAGGNYFRINQANYKIGFYINSP